jgi:hypothetical protein
MNSPLTDFQLFSPDTTNRAVGDQNEHSPGDLDSDLEDEMPNRKKRRGGQRACSRCGEKGHYPKSGICQQVDIDRFRMTGEAENVNIETAQVPTWALNIEDIRCPG